MHSQKFDLTNYFLQVPQVAESAALAGRLQRAGLQDLNASANLALHPFFDRLKRKRFRGVLVVLVHVDGMKGTGVDPLLSRLKYRQADIIATGEALRAMPLPHQLSIDHGLSLAYLACANGGSSLVLASSDYEQNDTQLAWMHNAEHWEAIRNLRFSLTSLHHVRLPSLVGEDGEAHSLDQMRPLPSIKEILLALTIQRRLGYPQASEGCRSFHFTEIWGEHPSKRAAFGYFAISPLREIDYWLDAEFSRRGHGQVVRHVLAKPICTCHPEITAPLALSTVLSAIAVASRLAFECHEQRLFNCNMFLAFQAWELREKYTRVVSLHEEELFLDFDNYDRLKQHCEMVQSDDLVLAADIRNGKVLGIYRFRSANDRRESSLNRRQQYCRRVVKAPGILIHFGHGGRAEVYAPIESARPGEYKELVLFNPGMGWRTPPIRRLVEALPKEWGEIASRRFVAALLNLLDNQDSSLVAILKNEFVGDTEDVLLPRRGEGAEARYERLKGHQLQELRKPLAQEERVGLSSEHLSVSSLQALFALDGMHCVSNEGRLVALGLRILSNPNQVGAHVGTGTAAAETVRHMAEFDGAVVIKVSSSGDIKFFPNRPL